MLVGSNHTISECLYDLMEGPDLHTDCWINPILPKSGKMIFGSFAKTGKSHVMLSLARALVTGENAFECARFTVPEPVNVLLFEQELGRAGLQRRARRTLAGTTSRGRIRSVSRNPDISFSTEKGYQLIGNEIAEFRPNVVIFDPIGKMFHGDENSASEVAMLWAKMDRLLNLGNRENMSIVLSHHYGKRPNGARNQDGYDPMDPYNFRGSSKWFDDVDSLITLNRLQNLPLPHQAWRLQMRFELRHDEVPPEMFFTVNRERDLRVRYERDVDPPADTRPVRPVIGGPSSDPRTRTR